MNPASEPNQTHIPIVFKDGFSELRVEVSNAMSDALLAQSRWAKTPLSTRLVLVRELRRLIAENSLLLAEASASARRRPAVESLTAEVLPLAEACRFLERNADDILAPKRLGRRGLPLWLAGVRSEIRREPYGVILIIGPGNYPLLLPGLQMIQALVAGNAVILKPGVGGTRVASELVELVRLAGIDPRLVALLPEAAEAARIAIDAKPGKVVFTGSAATGEKILAQLAPHLIPATMELSGCDAVIIHADADLDLAVKALTFGLTLNNGATCMSPKRVFVHRSVATELEGRIAQSFGRKNISLAPGFSPVRGSQNTSAVSTASAVGEKAAEAAEIHCDSNTGLKPGANEMDRKLRPLLDDALARGAHFIVGDESDLPVVLGGVASESRILREDIFAPLLSIITVADDAEAIRLSNDCSFALGASVFSRNESVARSIAGRINAGVVTINDLIVSTADARVPFGGRGRSGFGVTRGAEGLLELTTPKVITISRSKFRPAFDKPQPGDEQLFQSYLNLTHGRGLRSRWQAMLSLIQIISRKRKSKDQL